MSITCPTCGKPFREVAHMEQHARDKHGTPAPEAQKPKPKGNHYRVEAESRPAPICPECGQPAMERNTRYGIRSMCCGLWSWDRHPLVSAETHAARNAAHEAFDHLWKSGLVPRGHAYALLRAKLNLPKEACHMKLMDAETAQRARAAAVAIREELDPAVLDDEDAA